MSFSITFLVVEPETVPPLPLNVTLIVLLTLANTGYHDDIVCVLEYVFVPLVQLAVEAELDVE